jgi:hypothetical protein
MSENMTPTTPQITAAKCEYCGHHFPCIKAEFVGPDGVKQMAEIPVVPIPLPAYKKSPNLIALTGRPAGNSDAPPTLTDRMEGCYVYLPHELVCDKRYQAMNDTQAPAHLHLIVPEGAGSKAVPDPPAEGELS